MSLSFFAVHLPSTRPPHFCGSQRSYSKAFQWPSGPNRVWLLVNTVTLFLNLFTKLFATLTSLLFFVHSQHASTVVSLSSSSLGLKQSSSVSPHSQSTFIHSGVCSVLTSLEIVRKFCLSFNSLAGIWTPTRAETFSVLFTAVTPNLESCLWLKEWINYWASFARHQEELLGIPWQSGD